jgi:hypothetical protein
LALFLLLRPLVQQLGEVLLLAAHALDNLDNHPTLQLDFFAFVEFVVAPPVHVTNEVAALIVDHDALVEGVVFESAILPSLLLPLEIASKQADKFEDRSAESTAARVQFPRRRRPRGYHGRHH